MREKVLVKTKEILNSIWHSVSFIILLILYLTIFLFESLLNTKIFKSIVKKDASEIFHPAYEFLRKFLDSNNGETISRLELIRLSLHNMNAKKARTLITIGGISVSIGAIVFLVSIGYGLQELVITRVASLNEMRQADVSVQPGGLLNIDDRTISQISDLPHVEQALPLISVVGRVNYKSSVSDMAVYGVTHDYLKQSALQPTSGKLFESNDTVVEIVESDAVKGVSEFVGENDVSYKIDPEVWIEVYDNLEDEKELIGYTRRVEGVSYGELIKKDYFDYIKGTFYMWEESEGTYMEQRANNRQVQRVGYVKNTPELTIKELVPRYVDVLGITNALPWVEIEEELETGATYKLKRVALPDGEREAVVNRSMLKMLNLEENDALGKTFEVTYVVVGDLLESEIEKIESVPTEYTILGVIPDESTPLFYVPFVDLRQLGISNYSQLRVVVNDTDNLESTRNTIESMGYITRSVVDTVSQIRSLFATFRIILAIVGMIALTVASLGMFNTLTVSLLERTREIGLMKTMGMKAEEVSELFLTESMIMGLIGGVLGLILGWLCGKSLSLLLSMFSAFRGFEGIDVSYIPISLVLIILLISLIVGLITGIFPARRVKKISALNALRYE